ncbi:hypothetical protein GMES_1780 [Paraglaciecola mesophila KMM 241]|uniref:Uncharacterized protein n=1 Tax=Paraglaciecola mesophila KMM 241 TaxID=1128912 RepID=K6YJA2_9ALTE|nr:hypothetical protein GMES_1780 [Paraglaciecola mesophila KMM 241]
MITSITANRSAPEMERNMFFESWSEITRIITTTLIIYPFLI